MNDENATHFSDGLITLIADESAFTWQNNALEHCNWPSETMLCVQTASTPT
ncbi:hypothetical protein [Neisseria sp. N177_16]|uniref:hypothetical protein n=1 Tax=Neisseria sp. N177_16 TaxID=2056175 RepID=UPI0012FE5E30|nr:hypothetical protein [Neisseria sp. N177_16]